MFLTDRASHEALARAGFRTFAPKVTEYAFLEARPENAGLLRRAVQLGLEPLKVDDEVQTVGEAELDAMAGSPPSPGDRVRAIGGPAEGLEGRVESSEGGRLRCLFEGYKRSYGPIEVDPLEVERLNGGAQDR